MHPENADAGEQVLANVPVSAVEASQPNQTSGSPIAVGQRWHAYQIGDAIPAEEGWKFHAVNVGMLEDVNIHVRPIGENNASRTEAWLKLQNGKYPGLIQVSEAVEENGFRFEMTQVPPPATLREWADTHQASLDDVESLLRQLAATVQAIHSVGVVHCNLTLDTIHLVAGDAGLKVLIGGLDYITLYDQPGLIALPVNPLYAPPEAAGLTKHRAGPGLRGWDWWSLGRLMQELVLGQPVLGLVLGRDVSRITPELKARAEALLLERDVAGPKAGAVEKMPRMSDDLASLLRGLLSSSRDGRWGWREVQCWLKREAVPDRYDLSRYDRLFLWKDRAFTVAEAADYFSAEANWADGVEQIFDTKNDASFVAFVSREQELSSVREQLDALRDFIQLPAWREFPVEVVRTVIAAASWLQIGGERRFLLLRGKRIDSGYLRTLIKTEPVAEGLALARAIIAPPFIQLITSRDAETARLLSTISANALDVLTTAEKNGWLKTGDTDALARLMLCVLEGDAELIRHREELRKRFALSRHPQLETIFKAPKAKHKELILLAFAASDPERTGFVTHADWGRDRYGVLRERGERLAAKLFWLRLERILRLGPLVFGRWPWVAIAWVGLGGVIAMLSSPAVGAVAGIVLGLGLFGLRFALCSLQRGDVFKYSQSPQPWTVRSQLGRCREEALAVLPSEPSRVITQVWSELNAINQEIAALALDPKPDAIRPPPALLVSWSGTVASWALVLGVFGWIAWPHLPASAVSPDLADNMQLPVISENGATTSGGKPKILLTAEERFFSDPRSVYVNWNFEEPPYAPPLRIRGYMKPTPEQVANVLIDGQKLIAPYAPQTAKGVIAVPVTTENNEPGFMLYDVKRRMLVDRRIFKLEQFPETERTWHDLDRRKVLYLGDAPDLSLEMWADGPAFTPSPTEPQQNSPAPLVGPATTALP